MTTVQLALFGDPPTRCDEMVTCPDCGHQQTRLESIIPGTFSNCPECDWKALARLMRWYADHGTRSTRKRPGMSFPSGGTIPTPEDSAATHALLDELGWPR